MSKNINNFKKLNLKTLTIFRQKKGMEAVSCLSHKLETVLLRWPVEGKTNVLLYAEKMSKCPISIISDLTPPSPLFHASPSRSDQLLLP